MPVTDHLHTLSQLRDELRDALSAIDSLGLRWQGTRFHHYLRTLEEEAFLKDRKIFIPKKREPQFVYELWETIGQSRQLVQTRNIWSLVQEEHLRSKLATVLTGRALQSGVPDHDAARNTLLELLTAWLLHNHGFAIELTNQEADVIAKIDGIPPFAVECKRPASGEGLRKNFKAIRRQLTKRYTRHGYQHGIAVVAVDRVLNLSSEPPVRRSFDFVKLFIQKTLCEATDFLRLIADDVGFSPASTPIGAVILVGAAFVFQPFGVTTIEHLGFFNMAPLEDPRIAAVAALSNR